MMLGYAEYVLNSLDWYNDDDAYYGGTFYVEDVEFTDTEIIITFSNEIDDDMDGIPF